MPRNKIPDDLIIPQEHMHSMKAIFHFETTHRKRDMTVNRQCCYFFL